MNDKPDINKSIDEFFSKPKPSSGTSATKIGFAVFIAIVLAIFVNEAYEEYKLRQLAKVVLETSQSFSEDLDRMNAQNQEIIDSAQREAQIRIRELNEQSQIIARESKKQIFLNNYWKDIGNNTFINLGHSKRSGDLAVAVLRVNNNQVHVNVNCQNNSYWSDQNNGWFSADDSFSTEYKFIEIACSTSNDKNSH